MLGDRILLGTGIVFAIASLVYAFELPFRISLLFWTIFSIGVPLLYRSRTGFLFGLWGGGLTLLGAYLMFLCLAWPFLGNDRLFYSEGPEVSGMWLNLGAFLVCCGFVLTLGGIIWAAQSGKTSRTDESGE